MLEKPETKEQIEPILQNLNQQWEDLEQTTAKKAERLFDSNRTILYEQSCDDIDGWITQLESQVIQAETAKDLTTVNLLMQKQSVSRAILFSNMTFTADCRNMHLQYQPIFHKCRLWNNEVY